MPKLPSHLTRIVLTVDRQLARAWREAASLERRTVQDWLIGLSQGLDSRPVTAQKLSAPTQKLSAPTQKLSAPSQIPVAKSALQRTASGIDAARQEELKALFGTIGDAKK